MGAQQQIRAFDRFHAFLVDFQMVLPDIRKAEGPCQWLQVESLSDRFFCHIKPRLLMKLYNAFRFACAYCHLPIVQGAGSADKKKGFKETRLKRMHPKKPKYTNVHGRYSRRPVMGKGKSETNMKRW